MVGLSSVAAPGVDAAGVAVAVAHDARHRALWQGVIAFRYLAGAVGLALSLDHVWGSGRSIALGLTSASLLCETLWASRAGYEAGSRSEQANMALLEAAGVVYQPAPRSACVVVARGHLVGVACVVFVSVDVGMGLSLANSVVAAPFSPVSMALLGGPWAVAGACFAFRSPWVWQPG